MFTSTNDFYKLFFGNSWGDISKMVEFLGNQTTPAPPPNIASNGLHLRPLELDPEYRKKFDINENDFVTLWMGDTQVSTVLYRVGGIGSPNFRKDKYFMLLKYVEAERSANEIKRYKSEYKCNVGKYHLESTWVILDSNGVEKKEFSQFDRSYLVKDSCIYSLDRKYYCIETGEFYCQTSTSMDSDEFLFLENNYDSDTSRMGVMKINKANGSWELFSKKH